MVRMELESEVYKGRGECDGGRGMARGRAGCAGRQAAGRQQAGRDKECGKGEGEGEGGKGMSG